LEAHKYEEISERNSVLIQRTDGIFEKTTYGRSPNEERKEQMKNLPNAVTRTQFGQIRFIRIGPAATKLSGDSLAANIVPGYETPVIDIMEDSLFQRDKDTIRLVKGRYIVEGPLEFNTMMLTEMAGSMTRMTKAVGSGSNVQTSKFKQQSSALRRIWGQVAIDVWEWQQQYGHQQHWVRIRVSEQSEHDPTHAGTHGDVPLHGEAKHVIYGDIQGNGRACTATRTSSGFHPDPPFRSQRFQVGSQGNWDLDRLGIRSFESPNRMGQSEMPSNVPMQENG